VCVWWGVKLVYTSVIVEELFRLSCWYYTHMIVSTFADRQLCFAAVSNNVLAGSVCVCV
jgi:hypothetical protein